MAIRLPESNQVILFSTEKISQIQSSRLKNLNVVGVESGIISFILLSSSLVRKSQMQTKQNQECQSQKLQHSSQAPVVKFTTLMLVGYSRLLGKPVKPNWPGHKREQSLNFMLVGICYTNLQCSFSFHLNRLHSNIQGVILKVKAFTQSTYSFLLHLNQFDSNIQ